MIPVNMAQNDPIHIIRLQTSSPEALNYVIVVAYGSSRFNMFSNGCRVCGERFAKSEVGERICGRGDVIVC